MAARSQPEPPRTQPGLRRRIRAVHRRLRGALGPLEPKPRRPVVDELVMTVLSQNTSDLNSARAFAALTGQFRSWREVLDARVEEVADAIRSGGLADLKAPRIQAILAEIERRESTLDLGRLYDLDDREATDYLCSLPGVGPKTAACVLTFSMGRAAFPVDTHVHRVAGRLGWIGPGTGADAAHAALTPQIPPEIRYELHLQLIRLGRQVCTARSPRCCGCVLLDVCATGPALVARGTAR